MSDSNVDTDIGVGGGNEFGIYESCQEFSETLDNDDYWCWEMNEGDFSGMWNVIGLTLLINASQLILVYTGFINQAMNIVAIKIPINSSTSMIPMPQLIYNNNNSEDFLSLMVSILVHILYIFIKIAILSTSYMVTLNDQYEAVDFQQFVNARSKLLYCHYHLHIIHIIHIILSLLLTIHKNTYRCFIGCNTYFSTLFIYIHQYLLSKTR